jgi:hypothetical protein
MIPFFVKHYGRFADSITVYDNHSTDGTAEVAKKLGCAVVPFGEPGVLDERHLLGVKSTCWKGSTADFVVVCDVDEFLIVTPDDLKRWKHDGVTWVVSHGYQMYSNEMPRVDMLEITRGVSSHDYSKAVLFSPKHIKETGYTFGCHHANPTGRVVHAPDFPLLCHYHNIGGVDRVMKRRMERAARFGPFNRANRFGRNYTKTPDVMRLEFNMGLTYSVELPMKG